ncbi:hypothetical protein Pmani_016806 [Petrolisthes manimaculis]|uniref:Uncharacterized protein n=1 Tax=Petrolisthes manimaculis TaxID=1843537 RepID=A0AAE1UA36_9EUCA|nr:hypothetical protein Pmani_016806 [Petrolisthes manimaculis]
MKKDQKNTSGKLLKKGEKRFESPLSAEVTTDPTSDPTCGPSDPVYTLEEFLEMQLQHQQLLIMSRLTPAPRRRSTRLRFPPANRRSLCAWHLSDLNLTCTDHSIDTRNHRPNKQSAQRMAPVQRQEKEKTFDQELERLSDVFNRIRAAHLK